MNKEIETEIGSNIRSIRERKVITQEELSQLLRQHGCDITRSALAKIEVGQRHIYPDELILFRELLGVSYEEILHIE